MASQQFATFRLGGHYFGIEVRDVQEVMKAQRMTKVPLASTDVAGLINLRGQIVTALDLGNRLDLEVGPDHDEALNVVRSEEHTSELQSLMRISYAVFCLKKTTKRITIN